MKTQTLPFKSYATMNNVLINKLGCSDVYRAFVLSLTTDNKTNQTDTTLEQLAGFINESYRNYSEGKTTKSFTESLKETGVVNIETKRSQSVKGDKSVTRNTYTFLKGKEFRMIGVEFYHLDLDIKLKGYLIKLFALCNVNNMSLEISANEIYNITGVTKATQKKYNAILIEKGLLEKTDKGFILKVEGFNIIEITNKPTAKTLKIINRYKADLKGCVEQHNNMYRNTITKLDRHSLDLLLAEGMSNKTYQMGLYFINGFKDVKDINKLVESIDKKQPKKKGIKGFYMVSFPFNN